jgi:exonuclease III
LAGNGVISKKDFQLFYSGAQKSGQAGMGFYVKQEIAKHIIGFEAASERICKLRIKEKYTNAVLISVYAPPEDEHFYDELQRVLEGTPRSDAGIILGDLNAKLGREEIYSNISGKYTLHNIASPNGELLAEFVIANNMVVMSTQFQHKEIHKGTWTAPDHNTVNQIDHVIINASKTTVF